ncbi:glucose-induced degradation protein 8 homolog isoform X2 [Schistocerca gregaria]|uniref:glucose-induced degradation protein 8 homolog isoform X2 n=1 Tax=Schistocerca gregaria TaxID=7010 RepID=UPI00211DC390|nr:glucose-induced degradation protein 8 homolog isoform X2 [Schistocerca gregaria]
MVPECAESEVSESDIRTLINDYFVYFGLKNVLDSFCRELRYSGAENQEYMVEERSRILDAVVRGDISGAISMLDEVDPSVTRDREVGYCLYKQALLEIIRGRRETGEILRFAREKVAPLAKTEEEYRELERIMTLLLYEDYSESTEASLLDEERREKTAQVVNNALLRRLKKRDQALLVTLMKMLLWAQNEMVENGSRVPGGEMLAESLSESHRRR